MDERPWVLELVYKTKEDIILGAHGKTRFLEDIVTYNKEYYTDVLTNAYSRRYYEEYVQYINDVLAVAMIDADNFKAINDQYGHNAGDQAIKAVSKAIQSCIRSDDMVGMNFYLFSKIFIMILLQLGCIKLVNV